ncbi:Ferric reductase NAD-binding domain-containing protein 2 [Elsinoe fawcettii]|nr:Ferric reductase NAD-binding domain-containing protein 2 [Elsinoe fawcettii]
MWRFVDLSEAEKHRRRVLLDRYSLVAQLLPLLPLLALSLSRLSTNLLRPTPQRPSSPSLKASSPRPSPLRSLHYLRFWLSSPVHLLGLHLGSNALVLSSLTWTLVLLYLSAADTGEDYLHLTKRLGIVAASQLPWHYLLSWKSGYSPITILTGADWTALNGVHQALGSVITGFFAGHAVLYLNFFVQVGVLGKRIRDWDVILGLLAISLYMLLGTTALGWVRERSYRVFVVVHVAVAVVVLSVMWAHVHHVRVFVWEAVGVYLVGMALRAWETKKAEAVFRRVGDLVEITVERKQWKGWKAGQHLYLSLGGGGDLPTAVGKNPFSIASLVKDGKLRCLVRVMAGQTRMLVDGKGKGEERREVKIEGPYGRSDHLKQLLSCDRVLMVAGGVGMTFILPLLRELATGQAQRRTNVEAVWAVRSADELDWAVDGLDDGEKELLLQRLAVFVTGLGPSDVAGTDSGQFTAPKGSTPAEDVADEHDDSVEMQSLLKNTDKSKESLDGSGKGITLRSGRPDIRRLVDHTFAHSAIEKVGVYVCGPAGMGDKVRTEVGSHIARGRDVVFWSEEFGLS